MQGQHFLRHAWITSRRMGDFPRTSVFGLLGARLLPAIRGGRGACTCTVQVALAQPAALRHVVVADVHVTTNHVRTADETAALGGMPVGSGSGGCPAEEAMCPRCVHGISRGPLLASQHTRFRRCASSRVHQRAAKWCAAFPMCFASQAQALLGKSIRGQGFLARHHWRLPGHLARMPVGSARHDGIRRAASGVPHRSAPCAPGVDRRPGPQRCMGNVVSRHCRDLGDQSV